MVGAASAAMPLRAQERASLFRVRRCGHVNAGRGSPRRLRAPTSNVRTSCAYPNGGPRPTLRVIRPTSTAPDPEGRRCIGRSGFSRDAFVPTSNVRTSCARPNGGPRPTLRLIRPTSTAADPGGGAAFVGAASAAMPLRAQERASLFRVRRCGYVNAGRGSPRRLRAPTANVRPRVRARTVGQGPTLRLIRPMSTVADGVRSLHAEAKPKGIAAEAAPTEERRCIGRSGFSRDAFAPTSNVRTSCARPNGGPRPTLPVATRPHPPRARVLASPRT